MTAFKSDFLNILQERGFVHQCSDFEGLDALAARGEAIAYVGYDCTARSLHIGNYLTMMMLYWLQQSGNKPITLMGGGTTMVGDPSGKDETRAMRSIQEIEANKASIRGVFSKVLRYGSGPSDAIMLDNAEWLTRLNWIEMLRDVGRHFSVNRMLTMDSVKLRLEREQEMSFIEFNYMVCQAYDFVELSRRVGCRLQMGGSDQWGNIINGVDPGAPTVGELGSDSLLAHLVDQPHPIRLYAIAVGADANLDLLSELVHGGGLAMRVEEQDDAATAGPSTDPPSGRSESPSANTWSSVREGSWWNSSTVPTPHARPRVTA